MKVLKMISQAENPNFSAAIYAESYETYTKMGFCPVKESGAHFCKMVSVAVNMNSGEVAVRLDEGKIKKYLTECGIKESRIYFVFNAPVIRCYTEPQIKKAYQALLEVWELAKQLATTPPPSRVVRENTIKNLFK